MARIRTIKPEFFRHSDLFKAEIETKLPLRIAFAGLWTAADREGRFKWKPDELKLDCLPFDNVDFSRVIDALWSRGFIEKYSHENKFYGFIPSWNEHQHINNRESESNLPTPCESNILTCEGRVVDASEKLPRGRERKGKERKEYTPDVLELNEKSKKYFDPKYINDNSLDCFDKLIRLDGYTIKQIQDAILHARGDPFWDKNFLSPLKLRDKDDNKVLYIDRFLAIKPKKEEEKKVYIPSKIEKPWEKETKI